MEITIPGIITFVTLMIGYISNHFNLIGKKYIPFQNITIGIISGLLVYLAGLEKSIYNSMIMCLISALGAGGLYDTIKTKKGSDLKNEN